jgi:hypothetical protein
MVGNTKIALKKEKLTKAKLESAVLIGPNWIDIFVPIVTVSEANGGAKKAYKRNGKTCYKAEHWTERYRRHRLQKGTVALMLNPHRGMFSMPCHITLTRFGPRKLDQFDNLPMSLKYILDSVCEVITGDYVAGRADSHEGLKVEYQQFVCSQYAVSIKIKNI